MNPAKFCGRVYKLASMNPKQLRSLGVLMGIAVMIIIILQFTRQYAQGNPNWYYLVMLFGMLLILYYTIRGRRY